MKSLIVSACFFTLLFGSSTSVNWNGVPVPVSALADSSLVLVSADRPQRDKRNAEPEEKRKYHRLAHSIHVQSDIRYRYATTLVTSKVHNPEPESREIFLTVILPDTAFISRFAIEVDGQLYVAYVREKEKAWMEYQEAVTKGKTAGHVGISARHSNQFRVSVNVEARSKIVFYLLYEELLQRKRGHYEHVINLTPRQKLKDFGIDVHIQENKNLTDINVPALRKHALAVDKDFAGTGKADIQINPLTPGRAIVQYRPNLTYLQKLLRGRHALQFVVEYDVVRPEKGGEIQVVDGYFVHFVAPEQLPPMPKHIVFVLDTSGSMKGKKLKQVKNAMKTILLDLREHDFITIVSFSDTVSVWDHSDSLLHPASRSNVDSAIWHVEQIKAEGGTDINGGLTEALKIIAHVKQRGIVKGVQQMVLFLTDGHATVGETDSTKIMSTVRSQNLDDSMALFSLSFGRAADFDLLKLLSLQNNGFARKIYVAADAALQLQGFYKEVSSPILRDVKFKYQDSAVLSNSLTSTNFHTYYEGSEMVVAGRLPQAFQTDKVIDYQILATQAYGMYDVQGKYNGSEAQFYPQSITETVFDVLPAAKENLGVNFLERLWAYLTIQDLLKAVARGELTSCEQPERPKRDVDRRNVVYDDEDYYYDDDGSGGAAEEADMDVEEILDLVGDSDPIICNNLDKALFLSLKYEFVTPLTSLVVVRPGAPDQQGDLSEALPNVRLNGASRDGAGFVAVICVWWSVSRL